MGSSIAKLLWPKEEIKILFQGLDAAGKTTMLYRLKLGDVVTTIPTIGFNVETVEYKNIKLTAWDVGGRDKIRPLWRHYYPHTQAFVYVVDSADTDPSRLDQARDELHQTLEEDSLRDAVLLVLANKQDLNSAMSAVQLSERLELHKLGNKRVWGIIPTSAKTGDNVFEALEWLDTAIKRSNSGVMGSCPVDDKVQQSDATQSDIEVSLLGKVKGMLKQFLYAQ